MRKAIKELLGYLGLGYYFFDNRKPAPVVDRSVRLMTVDPENGSHVAFLYYLLRQRKPEQCISHKEMPTFEQHAEFVRSKPYKAWYLVQRIDDDAVLGAIYLTERREIGYFLLDVFHGKGYGRETLYQIAMLHGFPLYANVNPANMQSRNFLYRHTDCKPIQVTYEINHMWIKE